MVLAMDWPFGLTLTFLGMGVTLATLALLIGVITVMTRLLPFKEEDKKED